LQGAAAGSVPCRSFTVRKQPIRADLNSLTKE
jgi:hypothetical protein